MQWTTIWLQHWILFWKFAESGVIERGCPSGERLSRKPAFTGRNIWQKRSHCIQREAGSTMEVLVTTTGVWKCRKITGFLMTGKKRLKNDSFGTRRGWILILSRTAEGHMHLVSE